MDKCNFILFKQTPPNFVLLPIYLNAEARLLSDGAGSLIISSDNRLDFHDEIRSVFQIFLKYLCVGWNAK